MSLPSNVAVRALVTELSALHVDDIAAILAGLSDRERRVVEGHLAEHESRFQAVLAACKESVSFNEARISTWLMRCIQPVESDSPSMTGHAHQALLACAVEIFPADERAR